MSSQTPQTSRSCCSDSCCGGTAPADVTASTTVDDARADALRQQIRDGYATIARAGSWSATKSPATSTAGAGAATPAASSCCTGPTSTGGGCCGPADLSAEQLAAAIGYAAADLAHTPPDANMGLSCGNPTAIASLRPGETVLDLGSGGGFDCFVAGPKVGPSGRVIGVDMTPDMLTKARRNLTPYQQQSGLNNVEFRLGEIEHLPVADASVDVVISNCVLNLSTDKAQVWREIARVLRPGGRAAVSDLALLRPLPDSVRTDLEALVGCVAGAVLIKEMRRDILAAGLTAVVLTPKPQYVEAMTTWNDPLYARIVHNLPAGTKPSDYITSLDVTARKP